MSDAVEHRCPGMALALDDPAVPVVYRPKYREYGTQLIASEPIQEIAHCPWCAVALPTSLRDEYFDRLEALDLKPNDPALPAGLRTDAWWRGGL